MIALQKIPIADKYKQIHTEEKKRYHVAGTSSTRQLQAESQVSVFNFGVSIFKSIRRVLYAAGPIVKVHRHIYEYLCSVCTTYISADAYTHYISKIQ